MTITVILQALFLTVVFFGIICLLGYILYKLGYARNVEEGSGLVGSIIAYGVLSVLRFLPKIFRPLFRFLYEAIYEGWTGHDLPEKLAHTEYILSNAEVLELVQKFKNSPYIVPAQDGYTPNHQGILWLDIKAVGLAPRYQSLAKEDICNMAENIIQNFYMETRGIGVKIFIKVASPTRLYFAIPLSVEGEKYLEKQAQEQPQIQDSYEDVTFDLFEEEIPENEDNDDSWL